MLYSKKIEELEKRILQEKKNLKRYTNILKKLGKENQLKLASGPAAGNSAPKPPNSQEFKFLSETKQHGSNCLQLAKYETKLDNFEGTEAELLQRIANLQHSIYKDSKHLKASRKGSLEPTVDSMPGGAIEDQNVVSLVGEAPVCAFEVARLKEKDMNSRVEAVMNKSPTQEELSFMRAKLLQEMKLHEPATPNTISSHEQTPKSEKIEKCENLQIRPEMLNEANSRHLEPSAEQYRGSVDRNLRDETQFETYKENLRMIEEQQKFYQMKILELEEIKNFGSNFEMIKDYEIKEISCQNETSGLNTQKGLLSAEKRIEAARYPPGGPKCSKLAQNGPKNQILDRGLLRYQAAPEAFGGKNQPPSGSEYNSNANKNEISFQKKLSRNGFLQKFESFDNHQIGQLISSISNSGGGQAQEHQIPSKLEHESTLVLIKDGGSGPNHRGSPTKSPSSSARRRKQMLQHHQKVEEVKKNLQNGESLRDIQMRNMKLDSRVYEDYPHSQITNEHDSFTKFARNALIHKTHDFDDLGSHAQNRRSRDGNGVSGGGLLSGNSLIYSKTMGADDKYWRNNHLNQLPLDRLMTCGTLTQETSYLGQSLKPISELERDHTSASVKQVALEVSRVGNGVQNGQIHGLGVEGRLPDFGSSYQGSTHPQNHFSPRIGENGRIYYPDDPQVSIEAKNGLGGLALPQGHQNHHGNQLNRLNNGLSQEFNRSGVLTVDDLVNHSPHLPVGRSNHKTHSSTSAFDIRPRETPQTAHPEFIDLNRNFIAAMEEMSSNRRQDPLEVERDNQKVRKLLRDYSNCTANRVNIEIERMEPDIEERVRSYLESHEIPENPPNFLSGAGEVIAVDPLEMIKEKIMVEYQEEIRRTRKTRGGLEINLNQNGESLEESNEFCNSKMPAPKGAKNRRKTQNLGNQGKMTSRKGEDDNESESELYDGTSKYSASNTHLNQPRVSQNRTKKSRRGQNAKNQLESSYLAQKSKSRKRRRKRAVVNCDTQPIKVLVKCGAGQEIEMQFNTNGKEEPEKKSGPPQNPFKNQRMIRGVEYKEDQQMEEKSKKSHLQNRRKKRRASKEAEEGQNVLENFESIYNELRTSLDTLRNQQNGARDRRPNLGRNGVDKSFVSIGETRDGRAIDEDYSFESPSRSRDGRRSNSQSKKRRARRGAGRWRGVNKAAGQPAGKGFEGNGTKNLKGGALVGPQGKFSRVDAGVSGSRKLARRRKKGSAATYNKPRNTPQKPKKGSNLRNEKNPGNRNQGESRPFKDNDEAEETELSQLQPKLSTPRSQKNSRLQKRGPRRNKRLRPLHNQSKTSGNTSARRDASKTHPGRSKSRKSQKSRLDSQMSHSRSLSKPKENIPSSSKKRTPGRRKRNNRTSLATPGKRRRLPPASSSKSRSAVKHKAQSHLQASQQHPVNQSFDQRVRPITDITSSYDNTFNILSQAFKELQTQAADKEIGGDKKQKLKKLELLARKFENLLQTEGFDLHGRGNRQEMLMKQKHSPVLSLDTSFSSGESCDKKRRTGGGRAHQGEKKRRRRRKSRSNERQKGPSTGKKANKGKGKRRSRSRTPGQNEPEMGRARGNEMNRQQKKGRNNSKLLEERRNRKKMSMENSSTSSKEQLLFGSNLSFSDSKRHKLVRLDRTVKKKSHRRRHHLEIPENDESDEEEDKGGYNHTNNPKNDQLGVNNTNNGARDRNQYYGPRNGNRGGFGSEEDPSRSVTADSDTEANQHARNLNRRRDRPERGSNQYYLNNSNNIENSRLDDSELDYRASSKAQQAQYQVDHSTRTSGEGMLDEMIPQRVYQQSFAGQASESFQRDRSVKKEPERRQRTPKKGAGDSRVRTPSKKVRAGRRSPGRLPDKDEKERIERMHRGQRPELTRQELRTITKKHHRMYSQDKKEEPSEIRRKRERSEYLKRMKEYDKVSPEKILKN